MKKKKMKPSTVAAYVFLFLFAAIDLVPFIWMLLSSFKPQSELFVFPPKMLPQVWVPENYVNAWQAGGLNFSRMFLNTFIVVIPVTVFGILSASLAAFAFARIPFKGREFVFSLFLSSMMVPVCVTLIPRFLLFGRLGWIDSFKPLIVPGLFGTAFGVFLLRQFFMTIPGALEEAAIIDGASRLRIWAFIFMPLSTAIIATLTVFIFQYYYNDLINPLIYINSKSMFTVQLGISSFRGMYKTRYDLLMAASVFTTAPILILYISAQQYFVQGIVTTGLK
jgi:multiple sugar transport system permease protein